MAHNNNTYCKTVFAALKSVNKILPNINISPFNSLRKTVLNRKNAESQMYLYETQVFCHRNNLHIIIGTEVNF